MKMIKWKEQAFHELNTKELYEISRGRSEVFVVEQEGCRVNLLVFCRYAKLARRGVAVMVFLRRKPGKPNFSRIVGFVAARAMAVG